MKDNHRHGSRVDDDGELAGIFRKVSPAVTKRLLRPSTSTFRHIRVLHQFEVTGFLRPGLHHLDREGLVVEGKIADDSELSMFKN